MLKLIDLKALLIAPIAVVAIGCGGPAENAPEAPAEPEAQATEAAPAEEVAEAPESTEAPAEASAVSIAGIATLEGAVPERAVLDVSFDRKCAEMHSDDPLRSEAVLVGENGGLKNVVVYVEDAPEGDYPIPTETAVLDQIGCMYVPRIVTMRAGQAIEVRNSDPLLHNVRSFAKRNRPFNMGQPEGSPAREKVFEKPETAVKLKCDVHPWMTGHVFAFEHPFHAVTDENGAFSISGLPAGTYTVIAWHEKYDEQEFEVEVTDGTISDLNVTFSSTE